MSSRTGVTDGTSHNKILGSNLCCLKEHSALLSTKSSLQLSRGFDFIPVLRDLCVTIKWYAILGYVPVYTDQWYWCRQVFAWFCCLPPFLTPNIPGGGESFFFFFKVFIVTSKIVLTSYYTFNCGFFFFLKFYLRRKNFKLIVIICAKNLSWDWIVSWGQPRLRSEILSQNSYPKCG